MTNEVIVAESVDDKLTPYKKEIERLKEQNYDLLCSKAKISEENDWLNMRNFTLMKEVAEYSRKAKELERENEQLKQSNKRYKCINKQLEDKLGNSLALDMGECE